MLAGDVLTFAALVPPPPLVVSALTPTTSFSPQAFVQASDIAAATVFLCSPPAAQITGVSLPLDGGWTSV